MKFAITDIETTGSYASGNSITEIGICLHDGEKVIREFQTLLNPGVYVPPYITSLTGISNEMLEDAPTFAAKPFLTPPVPIKITSAAEAYQIVLKNS